MKTKEQQWETHRKFWSACELCPQAAYTKHKCLYRGQHPAKQVDCLFVGEAPGRVENAAGVPFVGPSGELLDNIVAYLKRRFVFRWGVTNVVACLPTLDAGDMTTPDKKQVTNCSKRLSRIIKISEPKFFIFLGVSAADRVKAITKAWLETPRGEEMVQKYESDVLAELCFYKVPHPAFILRSGGDFEVNVMRYQDLFKNHFDRLADNGIIKRKRIQR
jgi:uracil-DNA glycosylase family 4